MESFIKIVADDGNVINYEVVQPESIARADIEILEQAIADKKIDIEGLQAKVDMAKKIIALADANRAAEQATDETDSAE